MASSIGEEEIEPDTECMWWAGASDGTAPYSYYWYRTGNEDTSSTSSFTTESDANFTIYLEVTDARGTQRYANLPVTIDSQAPIGPSF